MRQNRNQRRLCSADRDPSLRFFDPQRQENRSRTKFFSSLLEPCSAILSYARPSRAFTLRGATAVAIGTRGLQDRGYAWSTLTTLTIVSHGNC